MRPTAADALEGAERLLRSMVVDGDLAPENAEPVLALLARARGSWSTRLPFLDADNRALLALLQDVAPALPAPLAAEVGARSLPTPPLLDVEAAEALNASLRHLLAQAVRALPDGAERERIRTCLLDRVEREPA